MPTGRIIVLNGAPRSGKSTLARAVQDRLPGAWIALGVDAAMATTPHALFPGIGLRPGGERPELEPFIVRHYAALYASIAAHARAGLDVVADFGHHDAYSRPLGILPACARLLSGLPAVLVGVRCPLPVIMARRNADSRSGYYAAGTEVPDPVRRWQELVHRPGLYDLELDSSLLTPEQGTDAVAALLATPPSPTAFEQLAKL